MISQEAMSLMRSPFENTEYLFFSVSSLPAARSAYGRNEADGRQAGVVSYFSLPFHKTFDTTQIKNMECCRIKSK